MCSYTYGMGGGCALVLYRLLWQYQAVLRARPTCFNMHVREVVTIQDIVMQSMASIEGPHYLDGDMH